MSVSKSRVAVVYALAIGFGAFGWNVPRNSEAAPVPKEAPPANKPADDTKSDPRLALPAGVAPIQVLAQVDDGKVIVKSATGFARATAVGAIQPVPAIAPANGGKNGIKSETYALDEVQAIDTKGKNIESKDLANLLKSETVAMASLRGQQVDPLHLRVLKEGTVVLILPALKGRIAPNAAPGGAAPAVPPAKNAAPMPSSVPAIKKAAE